MVVIQNSIFDDSINEKKLADTLQKITDDLGKSGELLIRLVNISEIRSLNKTYRHKNQATNVLSFPSELPKEITEIIFGDVVVCVEVVRKEAKEQGKTFENHLLHICIHGTLHLFGYDHIEESDAQKMENLEIKILHKLGIKNPYTNL
ncbi:MAG: rRNA maturation RNase YbeY [Candidatus Thioglobus sp.]|nr:MAG: rRNA maturation RNase YbeY [Candidatus Thioglobus sp.]